MCYMEQQMQSQMEGAEHEFNDLCERLNPPIDWQEPKWDEDDIVYNWRNYASKDLQNEWPNLTGRARLIIAASLNDVANAEEWDDY